jgi:hypothetical protein
MLRRERRGRGGGGGGGGGGVYVCVCGGGGGDSVCWAHPLAQVEESTGLQDSVTHRASHTHHQSADYQTTKHLIPYLSAHALTS